MKNVKAGSTVGEEAREKSFNKSPWAINRVTLIVTAFLILIFLFGILLISLFFTTDNNETNFGTNGNAGRAEP